MKYEELEVEVISFESVDVITASRGDPIVTPVGSSNSQSQSSGLF